MDGQLGLGSGLLWGSVAGILADPDAEVIALSPRTLMATNRFVCEICNKGFQRDQNLQLHRRGHNLPWKLRQRSSKEIRKRVYICPEVGCVHHEAARALGDFDGHKEALLSQTRRKEVQVRKVLQALCSALRLESTPQDMRHSRVPL